MQKDADIVISLNTTTSPPTVEVTDYNARVSHGGKVTWTCEKHPFAILFKNDTPFDKLAYAGDPGEKVGVQVKKQPGEYEYEVAVTCTKAPQPALLDPKIIVE